MRCFALLFFTFNALVASDCYAWSWQDLWVSKDQQAVQLMKKGKFDEAARVFEDEAWRASAAYRAGDYQQAANGFEALHTELGYYNQGNALAYLKQFKEAIAAYNNALAINPANQDALYNRQLVAELLKKEQQKASSKDNPEDKNSGDKQQGDSSSSQTGKGKDGEQGTSGQHQSPGEKTQPQSEQVKGDNSSKKEEKQTSASEQNANNQSEQKPNEMKTSSTKKGKEADEQSSTQSTAAREKQQAREQWLRLIPDNPGGLMKEKFLRDYLRRQSGWSP